VLYQGTSHLRFAVGGGGSDGGSGGWGRAPLSSKAKAKARLRGQGLAPECEGDRKRLCAGVAAGGGRTHKCVDAHKSELSKECLNAEYGE
jgi:hypothetical protein